jgi:hypothetical protein
MSPAVPALALLLLQAETTRRPDLLPVPDITESERSYRLEPEGGGLVYRGKPFTAHIAADGSVRFEDQRGVTRALPTPTSLPAGTPTLQGTLRDLLGPRRRGSGPRPKPSGPPPRSTAYIPPNWASPRELCQDPKSSCFFDQRDVVTSGVFVDWERHLVGLPARTSNREEKARFLAVTAPLRARMAAQAHAENLRAALWDLPALLDRIWSDRRYSAAERRRLLFELWAEYAGTPESEAACATILAFIRRRLPAGSRDGYTDAELDRYRTVAGRVFDPYGE